jgi:ribosome-associated protein
MKKIPLTRIGLEGFQEGRWVLLDYGYVIIHLFLEEARQFYDLELLWGDAPSIDWHPHSLEISVEDQKNLHLQG